MRSSRSLAFALALAGVTLFNAGVALADLGPPQTCPAGQTPAYQYGHYCSPTECSADKGCGAGATCATRSLCLQDRNNGAAGTTPALAVTGSCDGKATCPSGSTCTTKSFCGDSGTASTTTTTTSTSTAGPAAPVVASRGCACAALGDAGAPGALTSFGVGISAVIAALRLRRRRAC